MKRRTTLLLVASLLIRCSAFAIESPSNLASPPIGVECIVRIRQDASPDQVKFVGKIKAINNDWIVLESLPRETWIPRAVVLVVEIVEKENVRKTE
jgi:hypothetical protein